MAVPLPRLTPPTVLAALEAVAASLSTLSLALLLAATPPFECGPGYASPASPLHAGALAVGCVLAGAAGLLVATGMALVSPRGSATRSGALRALGLAALALALAGGALVVELFRWTCWP